MSFDALTLDCFIAIAETGSFTRAAERIGRTQSAISQQITKLEGQLEKPLLIRGRHVTLTPDGEIFMGYAKQIIKLQREALDRCKEPELQGEVRFGLPEDFASVFLPDVLAEYAQLHPRVLLTIECDLTLNLYKRFRKKEFDLVLVKMAHDETLPNSLDIWSQPMQWAGDVVFFRENKAQPIPLIVSPQPCIYRALAIKALEKHRLKWRIVFSSPSYAGKIAAVKAGMGITVLPRNMIPSDLGLIRQNKNIPVLEDTHVSFLKHHHGNAATNSLEEFMMKRLRA